MSKINQLILVVIALLGISIWYARRQAPVPKKATNVIIAGTNATYPPFTFIENNEIVGFDIDVAREVVKRMNKQILLKNMPWTALVPELQLGNIHIIASDLTPTPEREKRILFSQPYFRDPLIIITLETETAINNIKDLNKKTIIVNEGYFADIYMSQIEELTINRLETITDGFLALQSKRADAFVTSQFSAREFFTKRGKQGFRTVPIEDKSAEETYALGISKKYPELLEPIKKALETMISDSTLNQLKKKWNLQ